jgi:recombination protein RecT
MGTDLRNRVQQQGAAVAPAGQGKSMEQALRDMEPQFQMAMPRGAEAAQLVRDALTVVRQNPKLAECEPASFIGSLMTCAQLGLRPGVGALGHAYILPFWSNRNRRMEAQFILGYQGMIELANRSGKLQSISARPVHANDIFEVEYGLQDKLVHRPVLDGDRGAIRGYYAVFKLTNGGHNFIYATKAEIEQHRDKFATAKKKDGTIFGPWVDHFDGMALKTVIRELFKYMPRSTQIDSAMIADETLRIDANPTADLAQVSEPVDTLDGETVDEAPPGVDGDGVLPEPGLDDGGWPADPGQ